MPDKSPLSDAQAQRLIKLYGDAEAEILKEINRLLLKDPKSYSLAWQKTVLARVQQIRADLMAGSRTWCQEAIPDSYMKGVSWADKDPLAGTEKLAGFGAVHQQAVEVLSDNALSRMEDVNNTVGRRVNDVFRTVSLEQAKGAVIGYETTRQTAKRIREDLASRGITGFTDKAGHSWDMKRYAKVLAQETTNQSFRQGTINRFQEKGHDLVRLSVHTGSCPKCIPWQGQTMSLSGQDPDYPPLEAAKSSGVFHVGCKHVLSLAPEAKERFLSSLESQKKEVKEQIEAPKFVPAKTIKEAEEWAIRNNVAAKVNYAPTDAFTANEVNRVISQQFGKRSGIKEIRFGESGGFDTMAEMDREGVLHIYNISKDAKRISKMIEEQEETFLSAGKSKAARALVPRDFEELIIHETGHWKQYQYAETQKLKAFWLPSEMGIKPSKSFAEMNKMLLDKSNKLDALKLSDYATVNADEYFAEAWTAHRTGRGDLVSSKMLELVKKVEAATK